MAVSRENSAAYILNTSRSISQLAGGICARLVIISRADELLDTFNWSKVGQRGVGLSRASFELELNDRITLECTCLSDFEWPVAHLFINNDGVYVVFYDESDVLSGWLDARLQSIRDLVPNAHIIACDLTGRKYASKELTAITVKFEKQQVDFLAIRKGKRFFKSLIQNLIEYAMSSARQEFSKILKKILSLKRDRASISTQAFEDHCEELSYDLSYLRTLIDKLEESGYIVQNRKRHLIILEPTLLLMLFSQLVTSFGENPVPILWLQGIRSKLKGLKVSQLETLKDAIFEILLDKEVLYLSSFISTVQDVVVFMPFFLPPKPSRDFSMFNVEKSHSHGAHITGRQWTFQSDLSEKTFVRLQHRVICLGQYTTRSIWKTGMFLQASEDKSEIGFRLKDNVLELMACNYAKGNAKFHAFMNLIYVIEESIKNESIRFKRVILTYDKKTHKPIEVSYSQEYFALIREAKDGDEDSKTLQRLTHLAPDFGLLRRTMIKPASHQELVFLKDDNYIPYIVSNIILSTLSSPTLQTFIGTCFDSQRGFAYEKFPKRLHEVLVASDRKPLSQKKKLKIALDIAKAFEYLEAQNPDLLFPKFNAKYIGIKQINSANPIVKLCGIHEAIPLFHVPFSKDLQSLIQSNYEFLAPEILQNDFAGTSFSANSYMYGMFLWQLTATQQAVVKGPYVSGERSDNIALICSGRLRPSIHLHTKEIFVNIMKDCWKKKPENRPKFGEIVRILENYKARPVQREPTRTYSQLENKDVLFIKCVINGKASIAAISKQHTLDQFQEMILENHDISDMKISYTAGKDRIVVQDEIDFRLALSFLDSLSDNSLLQFFVDTVQEKGADLAKTLHKSWQIPSHEVTLRDELGAGYFGVVYKATFRGLTVACKTIERAKKSQTKLELLADELGVHWTLRHPNIVLFLGASLDSNVKYILMEYCSGGSLRHYLQVNGRSLSNDRKLEIALDIALGLNYLHLSNVLHCDLNGGNVLLTEKGLAKVADFGFSKLLGKDQKYIIGIPGAVSYMAPEVISSKQFHMQSDVYSFGLLLWEIETLQVPWQGVSPTDILDRIRSGECIPIPENVGIDGGKELLTNCLQSEYKKRPTFAKIVQTIQKLLGTWDSEDGLDFSSSSSSYEKGREVDGDFYITEVANL